MVGRWGFLLLLSAIVSLAKATEGYKKPHIIFILADDLGWNDVSFHGSNQIPTRNIDALAFHGVMLNRHYVQSVCTPTRSSLMTGKYPIHTGMHDPLAASHRVGLPLDQKILPQYFKGCGYATHIVGKWHLGYYENAFTPLQKGFDTHFGYWSGGISYYDHINEDKFPEPNTFSLSGHDLRRNYTSAWDLAGQYATDIFTDEAVHLIDNHSSDKPMFLYLAHLAVHAGNDGKLLEAPQEEINRFSYISDPNRRSYAAMVSKLDQSVGAVVEALERNHMLKNSLIVFLSDNGAPFKGSFQNWGSNYPWRGQKRTLWEGGVRTPALIWSPLIQKPSRVNYDLMHVTDWLPTLLAAAGYNKKLKYIDGINQWPVISKASPSPRNGILIELHEERKMAAIIIGQFKYVKGPVIPGTSPSDSRFLGFDIIVSPKGPSYSIEEMSKSPAWKALQKHSDDSSLYKSIPQLRKEASITCVHDLKSEINCIDEPCLFNIKVDPCEQNNVAQQYPVIVKYIEKLLKIYQKGAAPDLNMIRDLSSNPEYFNGTWSMWRE